MEIKLDVLPYDDVAFPRVLDALTTRGFIVHYECQGEEFGCIPSFLKHQSPNGREKDSFLPDVSTGKVISHACSTRAPRVATLQHVQDRQGTGIKKEEEKTMSTLAASEDDLFPEAQDAASAAEASPPVSQNALVPRGKKLPTMKPEDRELFHAIEAVFLSRNGNRFTNYPKEATGIHGIIAKSRARDPTDPASLAAAMIAKFWKLKADDEKFYRDQPFTPSTLNSSGIWDRVLEQYRVNGGAEAVAAVASGKDRLT